MKQKAEPIVSEFKPYRNVHKLIRGHGFLLAILAGLVAVIAAVIIITLAIAPSGPVCSTAMIKQAATDIGSDNVSGLAKLTSQIQGLNGYKNDPNCMYTVSFYYLDSYNAPKAKSSYSQLTQDIANHKTVNSLLLKYYSVSSLGQYVNAAYSQYQADLQNTINFSPTFHKPSGTKK